MRVPGVGQGQEVQLLLGQGEEVQLLLVITGTQETAMKSSSSLLESLIFFVILWLFCTS